MIIELTEYMPAELMPEAIVPEIEELLCRDFAGKISVEAPSYRTGRKWRLTSEGWVGYIPLGPDLGLSLKPKVPLENLFRMLEYAYRLPSFELLDGLFESASLEEFYDRLANVLAKQVLDRGRRGFYRTYEQETDALPYVRGRMDVLRLSRSPWDVSTVCHYHEHTADTEENRLIAWTLYTIARGSMCTERARPNVRQAYRQLASLVRLEPFSGQACVGRLYNRLNDDYRPLHALCRFFLENTGPRHEVGDRMMLPFLVNMARLFEQFVAEWLKMNLQSEWSLKAQETITISADSGLSFNVDLVLYDSATETPVAVLDTKYKAPEVPASSDIAQVVAYAEAKGCHNAILIYPAPLPRQLDTTIGDIRVRSLVFDLSSDLEKAGGDLVAAIFIE